jgi:hypothetical protein
MLDKHDRQVTEPANIWLDHNRPVHQMTWAPGEPLEIHDRLVSDGGWVNRRGVTVLNLYRPPELVAGNPKEAGPWIDHFHQIYPADAEHLIKWLAFKVQFPGVKINHAISLGGNQGIGKDTLLEPVKHAIGHWNFHDISPVDLFGNFNGFRKSVILRINEVHDLGEANRYKFYDRCKDLCTAPPDGLRCNEKNLKEHYILNCVGVIYTTNHKTDGLYLPADDRRTYVAWSESKKENFKPEYWDRLWGWYLDGGGIGHVAAYLATLDLSDFNPKAAPPQTEAFHAIVGASVPDEERELIELFEHLGDPDVVTLEQLAKDAGEAKLYEIRDYLLDRRNQRTILHRLEAVGYIPVPNPDATSGLWRLAKDPDTDKDKGKDTTVRVRVYGKSTLKQADRIKAARRLKRAESGEIF